MIKYIFAAMLFVLVSFQLTDFMFTDEINLAVSIESNSEFDKPEPQNAGVLDPIDWTSSVEQNGENVVLKFTAKLDKGWHLYSQFLDPEKMGPIPTTFNIPKSSDYKIIGKVKEPKPKTEYDPNFDMDLGYFSDKATFTQKLTVKSTKDFTIKAEVEYMVCDDKRCLPPDFIEFEFKIKGIQEKSDTQGNDENNNNEEIEENQSENNEDKVDSLSNEENNIPANEDSIDIESDVNNDSEIGDSNTEEEDKSLWVIFFGGFLGGLIALATPCVFPLIPMTVAFFTKGSSNRAQGIRRAMLYGFFIIAIYVTIGLLITGIFGAAALNEMSTNAIMNIIFFIVFLVFAAAFLGAFEIKLPSSWVNKADKAADRGGWIGIFFMAFTLALVSFSCTGPIIGTLIVEAANVGNYVGPAIGMFGFSLALAIPFSFFAIFPNWLSNLPQSGGWLNSVKVVLGLLEIALAFKFLSMVDLAYHWDFLTRELFVAIWIVIFGIMGFYLLGKIRFSHDSPVEKISVTRFTFAFLALTFTVYLIPGMWGAPLNLLSGVAPPRNYSEDKFMFVRGESTPNVESIEGSTFDFAQHMHEVGNGIWVFHDLEIAQKYAKETNKPILLDFTGHACANCRRMEANVWALDHIKPLLTKQVVIASLYVDDRTDLPEDEIKYSEALGKEMRTVGQKWTDYEIEKYKSNSQPLYIVVDHDLNDLTNPIGYVSASAYEKFLKAGIRKFNKNKSK